MTPKQKAQISSLVIQHFTNQGSSKENLIQYLLELLLSSPEEQKSELLKVLERTEVVVDSLIQTKEARWQEEVDNLQAEKASLEMLKVALNEKGEGR